MNPPNIPQHSHTPVSTTQNISAQTEAKTSATGSSKNIATDSNMISMFNGQVYTEPHSVNEMLVEVEQKQPSLSSMASKAFQGLRAKVASIPSKYKEIVKDLTVRNVSQEDKGKTNPAMLHTAQINAIKARAQLGGKLVGAGLILSPVALPIAVPLLLAGVACVASAKVVEKKLPSDISDSTPRPDIGHEFRASAFKFFEDTASNLKSGAVNAYEYARKLGALFTSKGFWKQQPQASKGNPRKDPLNTNKGTQISHWEIK